VRRIGGIAWVTSHSEEKLALARGLGAEHVIKSEFEAVASEFAAGRLTPLVDSVFDISQGRKAFERLQSGQQFGKVVVRIPE
jgi:NADPH:quinone reductase-like Zn-dependent oxidoreductase